MAKATATTVTKRELTLTLDEDEAGTLKTILANVGGHPERSPRGHASNISRALEGLDVKRMGAVDGAIYFKDNIF